MDKISIIVPVYNVEKYVKKCLESISNQTYKNIEIIIVNDGATDSSESICKEFVESEDRAKLYTKENGGLSSARNHGIKFATGKYVLFIDSDDYIDEGMVEELYKKQMFQFVALLMFIQIGKLHNVAKNFIFAVKKKNS